MPPPADPFPDPIPGLDAVVRAGLDADAARTDGRAVWDAVHARLAADLALSSPRRSWLRGAAVAAALAATVLIAVAFWPTAPAVVASPAAVVREVRAAHAAGPDRCYTQTVAVSADTRGRFPLLADRALAARVWTRGDRFVVEPWLAAGGAWGRDPEGRVWFAPTREAAARFRVDDLPSPVREAVIVRGLDLSTLLDDLLAHHDLGRADPSEDTVVVSASARAETRPFALTGAELTVGREDHIVRQLLLRRRLPVGGEATLTFDLETTAARDPAGYTAEGHLNPGAPVYDGDRPGFRGRVLVHGLGRFLANGL